LVLLLPAHNHSRVDVSRHHLDGSSGRLGGLDHVVELGNNLGVESVLHVLSLVEVVLVLLLAHAEEVKVLLSVHGTQFIFLARLQMVDVLNVQNLVTSLTLVFMTFLLLAVKIFFVLSNMRLLNSGGVKSDIVSLNVSGDKLVLGTLNRLGLGVVKLHLVYLFFA
jgi:hypothetical protein